MKRILVCIFTYNRASYLINTVRSVDEFFPWGDRWVVDDGSHDVDQKEILRQIASRPNWTVKRMERKTSNGHGGYPENTKFALDYALKEGYDYFVSLEDDVQFLWYKSDYIDYIEQVFRQCPDAIQVVPLFLRRINFFPTVIEYIESAGAYRTQRGWSPVGIANLDRIREKPHYQFICDPAFERLNSAFWLKEKRRVYYQGDPTLAFIPWIPSATSYAKGKTTVVNKNKMQEELAYILKTLDERQINLVRNRDPRIAPFQEYLNLDGGHSNRPIWHRKGQFMSRYYFLCHNVVSLESKAGISPGRIPICPKWEDSILPPSQNHLALHPPDGQGANLFGFSLNRFKKIIPKRMRKLRNDLIDNIPKSIAHYFSYIQLCFKIKRERNDFQIGRFTRPNKHEAFELPKAAKNRAEMIRKEN